MRTGSEAASWRKMALESMPPVAWLADEAPSGDVVLSSRCRYMRNLVGWKFPHALNMAELRTVNDEILRACQTLEPRLEPMRGLTAAEREYLVGARLLSPDFEWEGPGRSVILDKRRAIALMTNEEDHLRLQAVTAGWSTDESRTLCESILDQLSRHLKLAHVPRFGFVSASPYNCGIGRRLSVMLHLIGLAQAKRLPAVLKALAEKRLTARGLFGESSRAVGAYVQISSLSDGIADFSGACEYLVAEERAARLAISYDEVRKKVDDALGFIRAQRMVSLADGLRVLAWARLAALHGIGPLKSGREADSILARLNPRSDEEDSRPARAEFLRKCFQL